MKTKSENQREQISPEISLDEMLAAIKQDEAAAKRETRFTPDAGFVTDRLRAEFVAQVRAVMKQRGVKGKAALARLTGLSRERIGAILEERGNLELRTIAKIAIALEAPVTLRFGKKDDVSVFAVSTSVAHLKTLEQKKKPKVKAASDKKGPSKSPAKSQKKRGANTESVKST